MSSATNLLGAGVAGVVVLLAAMVVAVALGTVAVPLDETVTVLLRHLGISVGEEPSLQADAIIWAIRMPRVLLAVVVGASLGAGGAALQGMYRNPLADPQLVGMSSAAALGALGGYAVLVSAIGSQAGVVGGVVGGLLAALLVRWLGASTVADPTRFILTGVALAASLGAVVGFVVLAWDDPRVPSIGFWFFGSLAGATWPVLRITAAAVLIGVAALLPWSRSLDLIALGHAEAGHLGLRVDRVMLAALAATGFAVGAGVGAAGTIGFVGLVVPHVMRRFVGPRHLPLLLGSALAGATGLVLADLVARTAAAPVEIPVGLVTALVGGPFLVWLVRRGRGLR